MKTKRIGERAELLACQFLERRGLQLIRRNYHCRRGEIDLIMSDEDSLVFVEVRYRKQVQFGRATETVSRAKRARIVFCAGFYLSQQRLWNKPARFDVVSIEGSLSSADIIWVKDAFRADD